MGPIPAAATLNLNRPMQVPSDLPLTSCSGAVPTTSPTAPFRPSGKVSPATTPSAGPHQPTRGSRTRSKWSTSQKTSCCMAPEAATFSGPRASQRAQIKNGWPRPQGPRNSRICPNQFPKPTSSVMPEHRLIPPCTSSQMALPRRDALCLLRFCRKRPRPSCTTKLYLPRSSTPTKSQSATTTTRPRPEALPNRPET